MTLRARVVAGAALIAVTLVVVGLVITRTTEAKLLGQIDTQLEVAARPVGALRFSSESPPPAPSSSPRRLTALYVGYVEGQRVRTLITPDLSGEVTPLPDITAARAIAAAEAGEPFTAGSSGSTMRYRARAFTDPGDGTVTIVALSIESVDKTVARLVTVEVGAAILILAVLSLVTWWVIHLGIRPVKQMTSVATAIAGGDVSHRVPAANPRTEAGELGHALNQMLTRIEAAFSARDETEERLRQFLADASHELRTPVSTIRGYAELYRTGGLDAHQALDDAMRRTEQEAVRMGGLIDDLLVLARLDQGRPLQADPVDLAALAADAAQDARAVAPDRPVTLTSKGSLTVVGDEVRLRQVLANVVGNALVHTAPDTPVDIRVHRTLERAVIEVSDQGPGMEPAVAARAFERFYRADPARTRHGGGSGLGLSIVDAIVRAHGGAASLVSSPTGGTTVRVWLPMPVGNAQAVGGRLSASSEVQPRVYGASNPHNFGRSR